MSRTSSDEPDESLLYRRAVAGMSAGSRLLLAGHAASPVGSVVVLDLHDMSGINRRFGTRVGDRLMAKVESALRDVVAERGSAVHLGGDQFLAVVPGRLELDALVGELLTAVRRTRVRSARVTAAAGSCQWSGHQDRPGDVLLAAVRALDRAKGTTVLG